MKPVPRVGFSLLLERSSSSHDGCYAVCAGITCTFQMMIEPVIRLFLVLRYAIAGPVAKLHESRKQAWAESI